MKRVVARVFALTALGCLPASSIIDVNGNGLSDLWERQHNDGQLFGESFDPNADEDGDGWSNEKEAVTGTDPRNGTPPDGFLTPHLTHYPSVLADTDGDEIPDTPTTEAVTVTWPSLIGKKYTLMYSPDLTQGSWLMVDEPQMGTGTTIGKGVPLTQPDGSVPERMFWRVNVADVDTDGDGLSDHEENMLGMAPGFVDANANGLPDDWEAAHAGTFAVYPPILAAKIPRNQSKPANLFLRNDTASAVNYTIAFTGATFPGYSFEDSVSGTVPYTWEDISQTGTRLAAISNIDDAFEAAPFTGFAFPFYGRNFNQVFVSSNGLLSFGTGNGSYNNQALPGTSAPPDIIAPFWDDLDTLASGDVYYNLESDRFILQFHEVTRHGSSEKLTFQVVLFSDGRIQFRYQTLNGDLDSCTVGVQNSSKDEGVGVVFNASYLQNGMAVEIRPDFNFLKIAPLSGSVPANSVQSLTGLFRSWTLAPAVYYANVEISDDGPGASPHQVAGRLEVENLPGTVALESPANDHTALQGQSIAFAAAASDPEGVARVEFYYGATHFAEVHSSPYEIDSDALPGGTHQITARVVDVYGEVTDSERVTIHVIHDTDGDKMPDAWENLHGLDPNLSSDAHADADEDGYTNLEEYNLEGDPNVAEHSDSDGIPDGIERKLIYRDSWGGWGFFNLHDPDTDQNGIPDGDEDYDKDGLTTLQEIAAGTDANKSDTDTDGVSDGKEIELGTDPLLADAWFDNDGVPRDSDGDGLSDIFEIAHGSNPFDADTNNNGVNDGDELDWGGWPAVPGPPPPPQPPPGGGPEPGPDGPPQPPVALNPVDHQILVETKSISFPKHGFEPYQTVLPPKRFLTKTSQQRFHGGCPESGPEGVSGSLITSMDAITGESTTQGDSFVNTGGEPQSAVRTGGSDGLDTYDDPPNVDPDCPGTIHYFSLLGDENTTGLMVSNALDELEDFGAGGPLLRMALEAGETLQPGTPFAFRNVHSNELTFDYQKVQFKFKWNAEQTYEQHHALTYLVVFTPENDPNTPADESANKEVVQTIEWPGQEDESPMFTIDPEQKKSGVDGSYNLIPLDVAVKLKGYAMSTTGLLVKKGDVLQFALAPLFFDIEDKLESLITWQFRQRKADGDYEPWTDFGTHGTGTTFEHATATGGVFQIRTVIDNAGEHEYIRKKDEKIDNFAYGRGKKYEPDFVGVCDTQIQIDICREAQSFYGDTSYEASNIVPAQYGFPEYAATGNSIIRCNIFVAHRATAAGAVVPKINGVFNEYPPLANEWAGIEDTSIWPGDPTHIEGWPMLPVSTYPQPGWIIAHPNPEANQSGHCAITDYDGEGIGAGVSGTVNKNYNLAPETFWDGTSRFRKYTP